MENSWVALFVVIFCGYDLQIIVFDVSSGFEVATPHTMSSCNRRQHLSLHMGWRCTSKSQTNFCLPNSRLHGWFENFIAIILLRFAVHTSWHIIFAIQIRNWLVDCWICKKCIIEASVGPYYTLWSFVSNIISRLFGSETGVNFISWLTMATPTMLLNLIIGWLILAVIFIGPQLVRHRFQ